MKIKTTLKSIVAMALSIATISCSDKGNTEPVIDSSIDIEGGRLMAKSSEAADFQVFYSVSGSAAGTCVTAVSDCGWLTVSEVSSDALALHIDENLSPEDRTAVLKLSLRGAKDVSLTFLQSANPDYKADMSMKFDLDVSEVMSNSVFITVNPSTSSYYYYGVVPASLYGSYQTSEEFLAAYVKAIKDKAQADADAFLGEFSLKPYLSKGYVSHKMSGLVPLTDYYLVAFDLSLAGAYSGRFASLPFTSAKFPDSSGDFRIEVDDKANVTVYPSDGITDYVLEVVDLDMWNSYSTPVEAAEDFIEWVDRSSDYSMQSFMHVGVYSACYYNPAAEIGNITTGDYVAFAFGCNGARVTSGVSYKRFSFVEPVK